MRCLLSAPSSFLTFFLVLITWTGIAQQRLRIAKEATFVSQTAVRQTSDTLEVLSDEPATAIAIKSSSPGPFSFLSRGKERLLIPADADVENSYFLSLPVPDSSFFIIHEQESQFKLFLIKSGDTPATREYAEGRINQAPCEEPTGIIAQSSWRDGLPTPTYNRAFTAVEHMILHHSAGSNSATNYTQVVRDIYLYHTQVNGWSDIGYNYLVAQDGSIYAGRDPDGGDQLTVRGAHFCGANSGTSGVCLLGNYEQVEPTGPSLDRLSQLLSFSFAQLDLVPFTTKTHSTGSLNTLAGHRNGCATLCPGENLYGKLNQLRSSVAQGLENCGFLEEPELSFEQSATQINRGEILTLTHTTDDVTSFRFITPGGEQLPVLDSDNRVNVRYPNDGVFDITLEVEVGGRSFSLIREAAVVVSLEAQVLSPNPISPGEVLTLPSEALASAIRIIDLQGRVRATLKGEAGKVRVPELAPGVYVIEVAASPAISTRWKLIID